MTERTIGYIVGSISSTSINRRLAKALERLAPEGTTLVEIPIKDLPFYSPDYGVFGRFAFWALAMGLGYAQWFHLLPALLRRLPARRTTTLNLSTAAGVAPPPAFGSRVTRPLGLPEASHPPVPQFNDRGMTPLERVFRDEE